MIMMSNKFPLTTTWRRMTVLLPLLCCFITTSSSFLLHPSSPPPHSHRAFQTTISTTTSLYAKVQNKNKKKKKKASSSSSTGGGFGRKVESTPTSEKRGDGDDDDYAAFPALEESVKATLEPSPTTLSDSGELSQEIYDRLAQIYGLDHFNYLAEEKEEEEKEEESSVSFDELIASSSSDSASSSSSGLDDLLKSSSSSSSSLDLNDLIASASGGTSSTTTSITTTSSSSTTKIPALDSLPPFTQFRVLHIDPMVLCIDDFFTPDECDACIALTSNDNPSKNKNANAAPMEIGQSKTVGKDSYSKAQRTSTTWFHHYGGMVPLMAKASRLLGLNHIERWEEPQTVRYRKSEKFTWHLDALAPSDELSKTGGQRVATLLVYLADLPDGCGGSTMFRDLGGGNGEPLKVQPKKGSALLFFPAAGGIPNVPFDIRTLHAGEAVSDESEDDKWIAQLWLREGKYTPTAPPGNSHEAAAEAITEYCNTL